MKTESLVIVDQHATVNSFEVLYTPPVTSRKFFWSEDFIVHEQKFNPDEVVTR